MVILLIEDNVADAKLTREALTETEVPYELFLVPDGEAACHFLRNESGYENSPTPNLVLLYLNLPRKHGREVLAEMKTDATLRSIPVVVVSNSQAPEDIDAVYQLGGNGYLVKSGDLEEYFTSIKALVEFWLKSARLPSVSKNGSPAVPTL